MFEKIFFPVDLSKTVEELAIAVKELKRYGTREIHVFHVIEHDPASLIDAGIDVDELLWRLRSRAEEFIKKIVKTLSDDFEVSYSIVSALNAAEEVLERSKSWTILLPSRSRSQFSVGSVAEKIMKRSPTNVLLIKTDPKYGSGHYELVFRNLFQRVLVLLKSPGDDKFVDYLKGVGEAILLHVADIDEVLEGSVSREEVVHPLVPIPRLTEILSDYYMRSKDAIARVENKLKSIGVNTKTIVTFGSWEKIVKRVSQREGVTMVLVPKGLESCVRDIEPAALLYA